jgi:hypothetical protein
MATVSDGGTPAYQWYSNTTASNTGGSIISGATSASFDIPTGLSAGTYYYYCMVNANNAVSVASNVATVKVESIPAPVITINTQPQANTTVTAGSISGSLSIYVSVSGGVAPAFQWYSNTTADNTGGSIIPGATSASFAIPTGLSAGTYYYYCVINAGGVSVASNVATVTVESVVVAPVITIHTQPKANTVVKKGKITGSLYVMANVSNGGTPTYQWYSNTTSSNMGGSAISGEIGASIYIPKGLTEGAYYYYCVVSATNAVSVYSEAATVIVEPNECIIDECLKESLGCNAVSFSYLALLLFAFPFVIRNKK